MSWLGPYKKSFSLAWSTQLTYRVNFLVGRVREFIVYGALLLLYIALPQGSGNYSQSELLTYTLVSSLLASGALIHNMNTIAAEIADGDLSNYLLRPINYFGYWISQTFASRVLALGGGILQLALLTWLFSSHTFSLQTHPFALFQALTLYLGSLALIHCFDFIAGLFSFWTNRGHGMRWLIMIFIQFLSGSYIPLDTLPSQVHALLAWTPFPSLLFAPLQAYLGRLNTLAWLQAMFTQWAWIGTLCLVIHLLWQRGLKAYGAYGK